MEDGTQYHIDVGALRVSDAGVARDLVDGLEGALLGREVRPVGAEATALIHQVLAAIRAGEEMS
ncbi:MAG: hypothetical protein JWO85_664 [Candidatus Eremiobacteraeota bacterium]|nr:hypothetical protein [Candidatus Eremiobacteraeota bacterium]